VVFVLWFAQPPPLALGLAGFATLGPGTKLLMPPIARIGQEQLFAMQAFTAMTGGHRRCEQNLGQEVNCRRVPNRCTGKKTKLKKRRIFCREAVRTKRTGKKTVQFYAANFRTKLRRASQKSVASLRCRAIQ